MTTEDQEIPSDMSLTLEERIESLLRAWEDRRYMVGSREAEWSRMHSHQVWQVLKEHRESE